MTGRTNESPGFSGGGGAQAEDARGRGEQSHFDYDLAVEPAIKSLSKDELEYLSLTLRELIAHRIAGINYAEGRRGQIAAIGGALAAVGIALLPFAGGVDWMPLKAVYYELSIATFILGVLMWIVYARQTNYDYPFKTELATWKWFYHQALPDKAAFGPGLIRKRGKKHREFENLAYESQWSDFTRQARGLARREVDATQDLKQLYQLHVNERYKNLFLTRLRGLLVWGLSFVFFGAVLTFGIASAVDGASSDEGRSKWQANGRVLDATWAETGAMRTKGLSSSDVQFRVQASYANNTSRKTRLTGLIAETAKGQQIPVEFLVPIQPLEISPGESVEFSGYFWVAGFEREEIETLRPK